MERRRLSCVCDVPDRRPCEADDHICTCETVGAENCKRNEFDAVVPGAHDCTCDVNAKRCKASKFEVHRCSCTSPSGPAECKQRHGNMDYFDSEGDWIQSEDHDCICDTENRRYCRAGFHTSCEARYWSFCDNCFFANKRFNEHLMAYRECLVEKAMARVAKETADILEHKSLALVVAQYAVPVFKISGESP